MLHQVSAHHSINPNGIGIVTLIRYNGHLQFITASHHTIARRKHPAMLSILQRYREVHPLEFCEKRMFSTHISKSKESHPIHIIKLSGDFHSIHPDSPDLAASRRMYFNRLVF